MQVYSQDYNNHQVYMNEEVENIYQNKCFAQDSVGGIFEDRYLLSELVYQDQQWCVFKAKDLHDESGVLVRLYSAETDLEYLQNDIIVKQQIDHPNLASYKDWKLEMDSLRCNGQVISDYNSYVVTPIVNYKSIINGRWYSEPMGKFFFSKMLDVVDVLHQNSFYLRNISFNSFAIDTMSFTRNYENWIKLMDCGSWSINLSEMSPNDKKTEYDNIYALGILLFTLVVGSKPFTERSENDLLFKYITTDFGQYIKSHPKLYQIHKSKKVSASFLDLISQILSSTETDYPSIKEIRSHDWMRETKEPYEYFIQTVINSII